MVNRLLFDFEWSCALLCLHRLKKIAFVSGIFCLMVLVIAVCIFAIDRMFV